MMKNKILLLLFCLPVTTCVQAQLFNVIYVYEEVPAFGPEVLKVLGAYNITIKKGEVNQLYENFKVYRDLDSTYHTHVMKQVNRQLKNNVPWQDFRKQIVLPLRIMYGESEQMVYEFYDIGLIKKTARTRCHKDLRSGGCYTLRLKYTRQGKVNKKY